MAANSLSLPVDIPWKRLAASSDMMDTQHGDRKFPPKWRSSISIFYHEPTDLPETYCDRKITYLKIVCSITGYQVGAEVGTAAPATDDVWHTEQRKLGELYHPCYGAMLHVAVFPNTKDGKSVPLSDYPYIMDFEPKRRELYEAVSQSGEILGRSGSTLNLRKSATSGETTEYASKIGAEVKGSYGAVSAQVNAEHSWGGGTHLQEENVRTTDESREKRETFSSTTSLTQMYELFTGYHLGSNRALFYILSRPHTAEEKDQYTFVNGPRRLEGIQEVFLIVNRPKDQPGLCVEAFLETAHLFAAEAELNKTDTGEPAKVYDYREFTTGMSGTWVNPSGEPGDTKDFTQILMSLGAGCELDTSKGGHSFNAPRVDDSNPEILVTVPNGFWFDIQISRGDTLWSSFKSISAGISGGQVTATVTLRGLGGHGLLASRGFERFNAKVHVYYKCLKAAEPQNQSTDDTKLQEKDLFLTSRGLSTCVGLDENEKSQPGNVYLEVDWPKVFGPEYRGKLFEWLYQHQVLDLGNVRPDKYREKLKDLIERNRHEFEKKVKHAFDKGDMDPVPDEWLRPNEWVSFETNIPVTGEMSDPQAPALQRIRAANDLTNRLGQQMIESLGSSKRYADRTVDFWRTDIALNRLASAVLAMPDNHPDNLPIADLDIPYKEMFLSTFGEDMRIKDLARLEPGALKRGLDISEASARQLKLDLLRMPGQKGGSPVDQGKSYRKHKK